MDEGNGDRRQSAPAVWRADPPELAGATPSLIVEPERGRIVELDGIRGLAAVAIVIFHARPDWLPFGWAAVDLFFGLSGFLITSIILEHGQTPGFLRQFYLRRGLRIWPIYYITIFGFIVFRHHLPQRCDWSGLWYYLTYTQDLSLYWSNTASRFHSFLDHTWSLAIEEQFYLLWPAAVLLCGARRVPRLVIGCVGISVLGRCFGWPASLLLTRMDGLVLGGLLASMLRRGKVRRARAGWLLGSLIAVGAGTTMALVRTLQLSSRQLAVSGTGLLAINLTAMGIIGLVVIFANATWLAPLRIKALTYLSKISYGLYLYHYVILRFSAGRLRLWAPWEMPPGRQAVAIVLCFVAAGLSWVLIEQPILRLKRRFEYTQRQSGDSARRPRAGMNSVADEAALVSG
jgi:peptidoglycan/LPS O-acetylase OafA/YrhL